MKNSIKLIVTALVVITTACKSPIENIGPGLCPSGDFVFDINSLIIDGLSDESEVDLSIGGLNIIARFSEEVDWILRVVSEDATKIFRGKSDSINVRWFGNVDAFPLFTTGAARIELDIGCRETKEKTFKITGSPNFKNLHSSYGLLIRDFDKNGFQPVKGEKFDKSSTAADGWAGLNGDTSHFEYFSENPSIGGGLYGELYAKTTEETWYHGGTSFPIINFPGKLSKTNPDSVYLNFFCKGYGLVNTGLEIALQSSGETFFHTEPLTWEGWKLISLKLSDLKILSGSKAGEVFTDVDGINGCVLQLGSNPEKSTEARSAYDFIILTVGEPFVKEN